MVQRVDSTWTGSIKGDFWTSNNDNRKDEKKKKNNAIMYLLLLYFSFGLGYAIITFLKEYFRLERL
jgi:hypothetical protein